VFDSVVAVDAGVDHLFRHGGVTPESVRDLVYGAMFTRGVGDLQNTAIFVGGSRVDVGEQLLQATTDCFFGPMRVSVLLDSNGCNTTAAAAVLAARRHLDLAQSTVAVPAGTGPVGQRVLRLLAREGATIRLGSRNRERGRQVADTIDSAKPIEVFDSDAVESMLEDADGVIACGPPGVTLVTDAQREAAQSLRVAIDLNAVPPLGIGGLEVADKAVPRGDCQCYGAIGVGGTKMKIHRAALQRLFETNDAVLDANEVYDIATSLS
jgi:hypothetical protein